MAFWSCLPALLLCLYLLFGVAPKLQQKSFSGEQVAHEKVFRPPSMHQKLSCHQLIKYEHRLALDTVYAVPLVLCNDVSICSWKEQGCGTQGGTALFVPLLASK